MIKLQIDKYYDVTVISILNVGVIVELEDNSTELIHILKIANNYIADVCDYVSVGDQYSAQCIEDKDGRTCLSLLHLNLQSRDNSIEKYRLNQKSFNESIDAMIEHVNSTHSEKMGVYNHGRKKRKHKGVKYVT